MKNRMETLKMIAGILSLAGTLCSGLLAQEMPEPSAPKSVKIPAVKEKILPNKLRVEVIENKNIPLVTVQLLIKSGADSESSEKAGLANMTAALLTKGTQSRKANEIAEQMEFLGASIDTGANWNNSVVIVNVMTDKLDAALAIMADAVLNPSFSKEEIDLLKSQTLDELTYNLTQPSYLASYAASVYSFGEHPPGGAPASVKSISRDDISNFHKENYVARNAVLIFSGDISAVRANSLAEKYFGKLADRVPKESSAAGMGDSGGTGMIRRMLVIDLPNSGQAAVTYARKLAGIGRTAAADFYPASVLNSLLGGGYSSRLNQEIRIKRGLSYGAGSSFGWRGKSSNFSARTQTKNESAAEVSELVVTELKRLANGAIPATELNPRKLVLTGNFGRTLETTRGLAAAVSDLFSFDLPAAELNSYMNDVQAVSEKQIQEFAGKNLSGGDVIIVGDYSIFKADLEKRFPNIKISVVKADELNIGKEDLQK